MNLLAQIFVALAGLLHVAIFAMESLLFGRPQVHRRFRAATADVPAIRPWAFNQGFYNLFLAIGALAGVVIAHTDHAIVGRTLAVFSCACMLGAALVLVGTDRKMARAALTQGLFPLVALIALLV
jgi:putative membrane protein